MPTSRKHRSNGKVVYVPKGEGAGTAGSSTVTRLTVPDEQLVENSIAEFNSWKNDLTNSEEQAVYEYALDSSRLNDYLRGKERADLQWYQEHYDEVIPKIDSAIDKHSLSKSITVYRGVGTNYLGLDFSSEKSVKAMMGKTITDDAYLSTTPSKNVSDIYQRGVVLNIKTPKGKKVAYTDFARTSANELRDFAKDGDAGNIEYLFGRKTSLKLNSYKKRTINGKTVFEISATMK